MKAHKTALARMQVAIVILVIVVAAGVGAYALSNQSGGQSSTQSLSIVIRETDPVNQVDNFDPQNVTVKQGTPVNIAVQNSDDENRIFTIAAFNLNMTIQPGTTTRDSFTPNKTGTFMIFSPQTVPSAASKNKPGTPCTGYITVTA